MCRFAAYVGPPVPLAEVLYAPERSLQVQAYDPHTMIRGNVNVDGTGAVWWPHDAPTEPPLRYVTTTTPWGDANLPGLARRLRSPRMLLAVRSATPGIPYGPGNVAPFVHGDVAVSHNGWLGGFRGDVGRELTAALPDDLYPAVDAVSDSLVVFLTILAHRAKQPDGDLVAATRAALDDIGKVCRRHGREAPLNLLVANHEVLVAVRHSVDFEQNTLYLDRTGSFHGGITVASEPLDGRDDWQAVPPSHAVVLRDGSAEIRPLDLP